MVVAGFANQYEEGVKLNTFCGSPPYAAPELFQVSPSIRGVAATMQLPHPHLSPYPSPAHPRTSPLTMPTGSRVLWSGGGRVEFGCDPLHPGVGSVAVRWRQHQRAARPRGARQVPDTLLHVHW